MFPFSDKTYNILNWIYKIVPAFITFYGVVGMTLNLPYTASVLTILGAFNVFFGKILSISKDSYYEKSKNLDDDNPKE